MGGALTHYLLRHTVATKPVLGRMVPERRVHSQPPKQYLASRRIGTRVRAGRGRPREGRPMTPRACAGSPDEA
eukprot:scaffold133432_cov72-Phaeocystis_antarctica.AAC.1